MKEIKTKRIQSGRVMLVALGAIAITAVLLVLITTSTINKSSHSSIQVKSTSNTSTAPSLIPTTLSIPPNTSTTSTTVPTSCPFASQGPDLVRNAGAAVILYHQSFLPLNEWMDTQMPICYDVYSGAVTIGGANNDLTPVAGALLVLTGAEAAEFEASGVEGQVPVIYIDGRPYAFPPHSLYLALGDGASPLHMISVSNGIIQLKSDSGLSYTFNVNTLQWVGQ